jgi:hypothetical protein
MSCSTTVNMRDSSQIQGSRQDAECMMQSDERTSPKRTSPAAAHTHTHTHTTPDHHSTPTTTTNYLFLACLYFPSFLAALWGVNKQTAVLEYRYILIL